MALVSGDLELDTTLYERRRAGQRVLLDPQAFDAAWVMSLPQGRASMFSLAAGPELMALLGAAERLLAVTGDAVQLCPRYSLAPGAREAGQ